MKKFLLVFSVFILCAAVCDVLPIHGEEKIYSEVIRLHVIANSDSEEDQALKLKVRDAVLDYVSPLLAQAGDREAALALLGTCEEGIREAALGVISAEGFSYPVSVTLTLENYPTRNYESTCFPSGKYMSLRVMIGESAGQNWWCVLFPPLCLGAASERAELEDAFVSVGLNAEQYKIITETEETKYYLRFKILEAIRGGGR